MAKDIMKIEFGLVWIVQTKICIYLQTHHQHKGKGITIGTCQKWSLLQKALLTTRQIMYGNQSPMRNRKSGTLPSASQIYCCCLCLRYSVHIRMGLSTVYYPPMCHAAWLHHLQNKPLSYWMDYFGLIDAANSQTMKLPPEHGDAIVYLCLQQLVQYPC